MESGTIKGQRNCGQPTRSFAGHVKEWGLDSDGDIFLGRDKKLYLVFEKLTLTAVKIKG